MLVCTRLFFAMARKGFFLSAVGRIHPRYRTPHIAVALTTVCAMLYAMSGSYEQLFTYVIFGGLLFAVLGGGALFVLRRKLPDQIRPYRVWGYPFVPCVFIASSCLLACNTLVKRPVESVSGLVLISLGVPVFLYLRNRRSKQRSLETTA